MRGPSVDDNLTTIIVALISAGGGITIREVIKAVKDGRFGRKDTTRELIKSFKDFALERDEAATKMEVRKDAEIDALQRKLDRERTVAAYWRNRSGEQDYLLGSNHIEFPPPNPPIGAGSANV